MAEREWREASDMRTSIVSLGLILLSACLLRFWAIGNGIPDAVGRDESVIMGLAVRMMKSGNLDPGFFDHGGLYIHLQLLVVTLGFMVGALQGLWSSLAAVGPAEFYLWGRVLTAALGATTVLLVYQIGMRWGSRHALLAAGLMAVMPTHVLLSHRVTTAVPATLCVTLTWLLCLRANECGRRSAFAWAGAAAGLAASISYGAGMSILLPLLTVWMTLEASPSRLRCGLAAAAAFVMAFLVGAPYTLLNLPGFLEAFAQLAAAGQGVGRGPMAFLADTADVLGWPAAVLAFAGLIMGTVRAVKGPGRARWALAVAAPLIFSRLADSPFVMDSEAILFVLPFLCVVSAAAVVSGVSLLRRFDIARMPRTALIAALTVAALLPPSIAAIRVDRELGRRAAAASASDDRPAELGVRTPR